VCCVGKYVVLLFRVCVGYIRLFAVITTRVVLVNRLLLLSSVDADADDKGKE